MSWVTQHELNNSLVVFIHGLFGNQWSSWDGVHDLVQQQVDPPLRSYDIYMFTYPSSIMREPALDPFVIGQLEAFIEAVRGKYDTTVLIGHSQGGIVAKLYVLRMLRAGRGAELTVDLVITLGTPNRGVRLAALAPLTQVRQLGPRSENIRKLKQHWGPPLISSSPCPSTVSTRHIRSVAAFGAYDRLVSRKSASGYEVDIPKPLLFDHPGIAKSRSASNSLSDLIFQELRRHALPSGILDRIADLRSSDTLREAYVSGPDARAVAEIVAHLRPGLDQKLVSIKVASLLIDFLYDFPRRPLRQLSFEQALVTYTERQLGLVK